MPLSPATTAGARPALLRSIPFWILVVASLASAGVGIWLILEKISTMTTTLANGSATGVEVYAGQSWVILGGALLAAGLFGLFTVLALAAARSFVPAPVVEAIEVIEWTGAEDPADAASVPGYQAAPGAAEPVVAAEPVLVEGEARAQADASVDEPASTPSR